MLTKYGWENLTDRQHFEDPNVYNKIISKRILKTQDKIMSIGFIRFKTETTGWLL